MTISALLRDLATHGVRVALKGDRLQLSAAAGILTPQLRAEIAAKKDEIVAFLSAAEPADDFVLEKAPAGESLPLTFGQQRLWFLYKLDPTATAYNLGAAVTLPGDVDERILGAAIQEVARQHDSLRTIFEEVDGVPSQRVTNTLPVLGVADLRDVPAQELEQRLREVASAEVARPFQLATAPSFRALLLRESRDVARLVLVVHHIVADGWSLGVLVKEIGETYERIRAGQELRPTARSWQYTDYAYSEQRWFARSDQRINTDYWAKKLSGTLSSLALPLDRARGPVLSSNGASHTFTITADLATKLRALSRESNVTLFTTLLTVFKVLLHRYAGQDDIIVGTADSNRRRVELESLIGMFVSTLVLRTDLSGDPSARELLKRVSDTVLDAQEHKDYPFEKVVQLAHMERSLSQSPLFQTAFVLHNTPLRGTYQNIGSGSMFELSLYVWEGTGDLTARWEYNPDLFNDDTIARMAGHFLTLARAIVDQPDRPISRLELLTTDEKVQLLGEWNRTDAEFPSNRCIHELFEAQAGATPDAIALVAAVGAEGGPVAEVTYRELDRRANRLAHRLRKLGVGAESRVAIALDRSVDLVVAVLAVLKAGAAYVPLDPTHPSDRLAFMAGDAAVAALLTKRSLRQALPEVRCPVVDLELDAKAIAAESDVRPVPLARPHDLAYVIYTSGSTGKPKGVMIEHRSVVNLLSAMGREPGLHSSDVLLSVTTLAFDIAGLELYLPLITGARVVLVSRAVAADGIALARAIVDSRATVMQATPATWRMLLDTGWTNPSRVRILCGGEALPRGLANGLLASGAEVWNLYGPTETTIWSTVQRVGPAGDPVPIGRPIANTQLYVLDAHRQPVPVNVPGELYIGGAGLARGYHNRPELTAERFIAHPFATDAQARLYRTGDQVRYTPDGTLEYLGRLDTQVKVRGFRIELGEIESVLATHAAVQHAVVIAREDVPGDVRLVAYLVGADGARVSSGDLRRWLGGLLPHYMVPAAFVFVDSLPLTPNGKIDRRALPAPSESGQQASPSFVSPRAGIESAVAEIWRSVLRVERVGVDDNFFDLGGHSLLVVQMQSRLRDRFACELSLMELFRRPTVGAIAEYVSANATPATVADTPDRIAATT
jgi:amino acid adenylation domain-containing protein